ncbi:hypothetical protein T01_12481 [Trichinella spiralis]|uniref:Uncharacterized protein n=1 Tax=Trichinella spiralis TaxID=6334 RepID=A0A0V1BWD7_TRISP|nr:hypothetical protein T01_12481 [Trichinella spiralis]
MVVSQLCTLLDDTSYRTSSLHDESHQLISYLSRNESIQWKKEHCTHVRITMAIAIIDYSDFSHLVHQQNLIFFPNFVKCDTLPMECLRALTACLSSSRMHRIVPHGSMQLTTFDKSKRTVAKLLKAESVARLLRLFLASFSLSGTGRHLSKNAPSALAVVGGSIISFCQIQFIHRSCTPEHSNMFIDILLMRDRE